MDEQREPLTTISEDAYAILEELARESGRTIPELIRAAIALERWFHETQRHRPAPTDAGQPAGAEDA